MSMREWSNPWNPFNSAKVLVWREWLEGCAKLNFLSPISVDTDPSNRCNFDCIWCNAFQYMQGEKHDIPEDHLLRLADFYAEWGVYSTCVSGGGEPFMNKGVGSFLLRLKENGIQPGPITNGSLLNDELIDIIARTCRWIGISMDAGTSETYMKVKGIVNKTIFDRVVENICKLTKRVKELNTECDVCYKYLLHPINAKEILQAAELAKSLGVKDFHLRPVGWDNVAKTNGKEGPDFNSIMEEINYQIEKAMSLEDLNFHVYGVRHKFQPNFQRKVNFSKCWAAPLILTFGADGNCHLCFDIRGRKDLILCSHYPDPHEVLKHWNSNRHKDILQSIDVKKCPRCTFGPYNEVIEKVFQRDSMCRFFP